ncbi:hypothetical protein GCM10010168_51320 [Actinoplanes ianthinogenes]|uniref:DUF4913 domain-containing protein n=1 Tax=Actinoplanes ianthinogenes TaxID=122358 RepID=A0ABM7M3F0_9ACTN|nr:hypothetical protein [Actinoplanes ianthinogenes]BCJ46183.1 hypothetical protein Aiant_68400 [Actinoplanes ianthinogenes]GGR26871.1 hypothetical protein GCM10010168_51320 [Actinoplanes ianthinogenes]
MSDIGGIAEEVALLRLDVDDLTAAVEQLSAAPGSRRWSWRDADAETAAHLWAELIDWVDWLVPRYDLTGTAATIPPCWFRHPIAVEELTALMASWHAAYRDGPAEPRDDLVAWHDRWLWPTVDRLQARAGWRGCVDNRVHQDRPARAWAPDPQVAAFVAQDVDRRKLAHSGDTEPRTPPR